MTFLLYLLGVIAAFALFSWAMVGFALVTYIKARTDELIASFENELTSVDDDAEKDEDEEDDGDWWKKEKVP